MQMGGNENLDVELVGNSLDNRDQGRQTKIAAVGMAYCADMVGV